MLNFSGKLIFMVLLILNSHKSAILAEVKKTNSDRWLSLDQDVLDAVQKQIVASGTTIPITYSQKCQQYDPKNAAKSVEVCIVNFDQTQNFLSMEFRNPINRFELEYSNLDILNPSSDIKIDTYVTEFVTSLKDLVIDDKLKRDTIKAAITAAIYCLKGSIMA